MQIVAALQAITAARGQLFAADEEEDRHAGAEGPEDRGQADDQRQERSFAAIAVGSLSHLGIDRDGDEQLQDGAGDQRDTSS